MGALSLKVMEEQEVGWLSLFWIQKRKQNIMEVITLAVAYVAITAMKKNARMSLAVITAIYIMI
jgi:hypothetical protein